MDKLNYYRTRVNAYRIPPTNKNLKNAYYCTFCKKSFESAYSLEKVTYLFKSIKNIENYYLASWLERSS